MGTGAAMDWLIARVKAILTTPQTEWPVIAREPGEPAVLFVRYVAILAAIPAVARFVGSSLIGQDFKGTQWFHSRPSAGGYDALASAGTNLGPNSPDLLKAVQAARAEVAEQNGVSPADVPPDAVTSSGSGLDPHISPAYADLQVDRVARARRPDLGRP